MIGRPISEVSGTPYPTERKGSPDSPSTTHIRPVPATITSPSGRTNRAVNPNDGISVIHWVPAEQTEVTPSLASLLATSTIAPETGDHAGIHESCA